MLSTVKNTKIAIYPGSFDPITKGHLDVLERASHLFDKVFIAIALNTSKQSLFSAEERLTLIKDNLHNFKNVEAIEFRGLTIDLAKKLNAKAIIRGLRAVSDFEYEFQLAQMNRHMDPEIETIFLMPNQDYFYISSNLIKNVSHFSPEKVKQFVPKNVLNALKLKFQHQ